jgi:hypothetical protein
VPLKNVLTVPVIAAAILDATPGGFGCGLACLAAVLVPGAARSADTSPLRVDTGASDPASIVAVFATTASFFRVWSYFVVNRARTLEHSRPVGCIRKRARSSS